MSSKISSKKGQVLSSLYKSSPWTSAKKQWMVLHVTALFFSDSNRKMRNAKRGIGFAPLSVPDWNPIDITDTWACPANNVKKKKSMESDLLQVLCSSSGSWYSPPISHPDFLLLLQMADFLAEKTIGIFSHGYFQICRICFILIIFLFFFFLLAKADAAVAQFSSSSCAFCHFLVVPLSMDRHHFQ